MKRELFNLYIAGKLFTELFNELGWDRVKAAQFDTELTIDEIDISLKGIAQKRGLIIYHCDADAIPVNSFCRKLDIRLRKYSNDYILIFTERKELHHLWLAPVKTNEKRELVNIEYASSDQTDFLYSKLADLSFDLNEEVTIVDVTSRIQGAFQVNSAKITKDFYAGFKKQHHSFLKFIKGITNDDDRQWYASIMLNRLMFCYFIQKKGFLNFDEHYLRNKLEWIIENKAELSFFSFYKSFLCALFHDGLNRPSHDPEFIKLYGRIPYLNGGMFDNHQIEQKYKDIDIEDEAFEDLFNFFDKWRWHLDTRITASGKDINPDVLGYIFEQYINDRAQMGAYYTKEDITEYIGKNCIIPFLMDEMAKKSPQDFTDDGFVWKTLRQSGDKYIYSCILKGIDRPLPDYIEQGVNTELPDLLKRREHWNEPAFEEYALPTEIWRETVERRERCKELRTKIANGDILHINDFITYNLDIRSFVQDLLTTTSDHLFIKRFYQILRQLSVLDPTCGSGAFLFAALNILEPLYETCITRMEEFNATNPNLFKEELSEITAKYRSNIQYFIYKSIILRNLYGVDIMVEATEIAKLRLFLKMVAVVDVDKRADNLGLDPLPDIDFNIRCGNTLVGYATEEELQRDLNHPKDIFEELANQEFKDKVLEGLDQVAMAYTRFKEIQFSLTEDMVLFKEAKTGLRNRLASLNDDLNKRLHGATSRQPYDEWKHSHQPFHWLAEYYQIMKGKGGFDVIIGNPPYVVYNKKDNNSRKAISDIYSLNGYNLLVCNNLYAFIIERSRLLSNTKVNIGMIVPLTLVSNNNMQPLRNLISTKGICYYSHYEIRPAKLFEGVDQRLTIFILRNSEFAKIKSTAVLRWNNDIRKILFHKISYADSYNNNTIWRFSSKIEQSIYSKFLNHKPAAINLTNDKNFENRIYYRTAGVRYWIIFLRNGFNSNSLSNKVSFFKNKFQSNFYMSAFNSNLFWWYYAVNFDMFNLKDYMIFNFRLNYSLDNKLLELSKRLEDDFEKNKEPLITKSKTRGTISSFIYKKKKSKALIDKVDQILANHYTFNDEELDFIINYDIKYRMGAELNEEE